MSVCDTHPQILDTREPDTRQSFYHTSAPWRPWSTSSVGNELHWSPGTWWPSQDLGVDIFKKHDYCLHFEIRLITLVVNLFALPNEVVLTRYQGQDGFLQVSWTFPNIPGPSDQLLNLWFLETKIVKKDSLKNYIRYSIELEITRKVENSHTIHFWHRKALEKRWFGRYVYNTFGRLVGRLWIWFWHMLEALGIKSGGVGGGLLTFLDGKMLVENQMRNNLHKTYTGVRINLVSNCWNTS